jgi:Uri superfamily endonuclease
LVDAVNEWNLPESGVYNLVFLIKNFYKIRIGALGQFGFVPGYYTYTGRAMKNMPQRIKRHLKRKGKKKDGI